MIFNNKLSLEIIINQKIQEAVNVMAKKIYDKLLDFIQIDIYDTYEPNASAKTHYERTYEFKDKAWALSEAQEFAGYISASIDYNPYSLSYIPNKYVHGSPAQDRRKELASILNRGIESWEGWDFGRHNGAQGYSSYPKPFFNDTINWIEENWDNLVIQSFKKVGLKIKKI